MTIMPSKESFYKFNKRFDGFSLNQAAFRSRIMYVYLGSQNRKETRSGRFIKLKREENSASSQQRPDIVLCAINKYYRHLYTVIHCLRIPF